MADLARVLRDALRVIEQEMLTELASAGFTGLRPGHMIVFRHLDADGMTLSQLARDASVTRQTLTEVVAELKQLGIVELASDPTDRRARVVQYTDYGKAGFKQALNSFAEIERRHAGEVGGRALQTTVRVLQRIAGSTNKHGAASRSPRQKPRQESPI